MGFMKPRVFTQDAFLVETEIGTEVVLRENVGDDPDHDDLGHYLEGDFIESVELKRNAIIGHIMALGYMDQTPLAIFETEQAAWDCLVGHYPETFHWYVALTTDPEAGETPTAHIYLPTESAAKAVLSAVQSINGSMLERDGCFVYAAVHNASAAQQELIDTGFSTTEL